MTSASLLEYLRRPLRAAPLLLIAVFAVLLTLASRAGLLGLPLALILLSWFLKYAFVVLDAAARGLREPPVLSIEMVNPASEQRPLGQLLIIGVFYAASGALTTLLGAKVVLCLRVLGLLVLPACIAVLASTGSILSAINPRMLVGMIRRLGWDYLLIWGAIAVLALAAIYVSRQLVGSPFFGLPLAIGCLMYGWLAVFSIIGGALYERRHEIGHDVWRSPEREQTRTEYDVGREHARVIDELYGHWRGGAYKEALQAAENRLANRHHSLEEYAWLCTALLRWPDRRLASRLAQDYIQRLLAARQPSAALAAARRHLDADPDFRPATAAELLRLAELARDGGDRSLARALLIDFERHFPNDQAASAVAELSQQLSR
jgi:hypothetical protein